MGKASRRHRHRQPAPENARTADGAALPVESTRLELMLAGGLGLLTFGVYLATLQRAVPPGDSGELIAVAYTLGTAHPPGYPLYTLLASLFASLPLGTVAWRVNVMSAVLDAGAAALLLSAVARWTGSSWAGVLAGGLFAFSPLVWSYAVVAEVFALNNLLIALMLWLGVRFQAKPSLETTGWMALVASLAAANHHTSILVSIPIGLWMLFRAPVAARQPAVLARLAASVAAGFLPYLYLPIAGARLPMMSWGDFSSVGGFLHHFLRRDYGTFQLGSGTARHDQLVAGIASYVADLPTELLVIGPLLALLGLIVTARREGPRGLATMTAISIATYLAVFGSLANLSFDDSLMYGVIARFWQQPTVIVCAWAGLGLAAVATWLTRSPSAWRPLTAAAAPMVAVLAVGLQIGLHYTDRDQSDNDEVEAYGRAILESLPRDALLISLGDLDTNTIRYLQLCEALRPDVRVVDRAMLSYPWTRGVVARRLPDVVLPERAFSRRSDGLGTTAGLTELIDLNAGRFPIFVSVVNEDEDQAWREPYDSWPYGTVEWIVRRDAPVDLADYIVASDRARQALRERVDREWPETTWEHHAVTRYRNSEFSRGLKLLHVGIERGTDRQAFELAGSVFEDLSAHHPAPSPALFKNAGLAYQYLAGFDAAYGSRAVEWWRRYLRVAPASDGEVAAIRTIVEQAASRN